MAIDFRIPGDIQVIIVNYLNGVLEYFLEVITGRSRIQEVNNLYHELGLKKSGRYQTRIRQ